jgi:transposase
MDNQAALMTKDNANDGRLYLAQELSEKTWKLAFSDGRCVRARIRSIEAGNLQGLTAEMAQAKRQFGLTESVRTVSCYEAGREGFWLHRALTERGIENVIVDSSSIDVQRRKRAKTDRLDAESLVRKLVRYDSGELGVWSVVRVPSVESEDARQLHRETDVLQQEQQQHRNRIQSLLFTQGIVVPMGRKRIRNLDELRCWNGEPVPADMRERIRREYARLELVREQLSGLRKEQQGRLKNRSTPAMEKIRLLQKLCGIAMTSSWIFVMELFGWRRFSNRRELAGALGLTPMPYQSGSSAHEQGISRAGNRRVRRGRDRLVLAALPTGQ